MLFVSAKVSQFALLPQGQTERASRAQAMVAQMISEELSHGRLCAAVVAALGGAPIMEVGDLEPVPMHEDASPLEGLLRNILSISCLSETVAVALIDAERAQAGPEALQAILREILADEVQHARFGWRVLEAHQADLTPALRERLSDYLVEAFYHLRAHELEHLPARPSPSALAESYGVCDGHDARALFYETVMQVIIPRLQELGLDAARAWQASLVLESQRLSASA